MNHPQAKLVRLFTAALVVVTFVLITIGGLVTSRNAGLSVPDWPTSFGRWLVLPLRLWADAGVFLEHNHRLTGAAAGLMAIAAYIVVGRMFGFLSRAGALAGLILMLYLVQGVMGGLRVTEKSIPLAVLHGVLGQVVLALTVVLATRVRHERPPAARPRAGLRTAYVLLAVLLVQLLLGAIVRHTNSASSIPDAPLVYGSLTPPGKETIAAKFYELGGDEFRVYVEEPAAPIDAQGTPHTLDAPTRPAGPPTVGQVHTQYLHRVLGLIVIPAVIVALGYRLARDPAARAAARRPLLILAHLWIVQALLGLSVIWSRERWEIASGHQAVGALFLAVATWLAVRIYCGQTVVTEHTPGGAGG